MNKIISIFGAFAILGCAAHDVYGVAMTSQIQKLLSEKQDKIAQLEKCEGKKQGWMIAGISTIGLTVVGVGVNIAQASKSNKLSDEIYSQKNKLTSVENELSTVNSEIAAKRAEKESKRAEKEAEYQPNTSPSDALSYDEYKLSCEQTSFRFRSTDVANSPKFEELNKMCKMFTGANMVTLGVEDKDGTVLYDCFKYREAVSCGTPIRGGVLDGTCWIGGLEDGKTGVYKEDKDGKFICFANSEAIVQTIPCDCVEASGHEQTPKPVQGSSQKPTSPGQGSGAATNTGGRVVGQACIAEDINKLAPYGWESGEYIRVSESANSKTVLKAHCETKTGSGDSVPCNCKAKACNTQKGYDENPNSNGLCVKKKLEQKEENKVEPKEEKSTVEKEEEPKSKEITLDASDEGTGFCYYDIDGNDSGGSISGCNNPGDWGVKFPNYTVYGTAVCNHGAAYFSPTVSLPTLISSARYPSTKINQTNKNGSACWCKMTEPTGVYWSGWNYGTDKERCADKCAFDCATALATKEEFREILFAK